MKKFSPTDWVVAGIRTGAATATLWLIAALAHFNVVVPDDAGIVLFALLFGLAVAIWNMVIHLLAKKVHPYFGYLLIINKAPTYPSPAQPETAVELEDGAKEASR